MSTRVGLHAADDGLDQDARREVLPRPLLALAGGFFQQSLEGRGLDVDVEGRPLGLVNQAEQLLEIDRIVEARLSPGKDVAEHTSLLAERAQEVDVVILQSCAGLVDETRPIAAFRQLDAALVGHLEEQQVGDLLDVIAVVDPIVAQGVAETPEFLDDIAHVAMASLIG